MDSLCKTLSKISSMMDTIIEEIETEEMVVNIKVKNKRKYLKWTRWDLLSNTQIKLEIEPKIEGEVILTIDTNSNVHNFENLKLTIENGFIYINLENIFKGLEVFTLSHLISKGIINTSGILTLKNITINKIEYSDIDIEYLIEE